MPEDRFVPLLTKLEGDYEAASVDPETARDLVAYAINESSDYWADLALNWVDHGVPASAVEADLRRLATAGNQRSQALRHKAKRLISRT